MIIFWKRKFNGISVDIIDKKMFNSLPLKLKRKKSWGKKKNFADLPTLFQNEGEIVNKTTGDSLYLKVQGTRQNTSSYQ